jgi:hypothetical protein
MGYFTVGLGIGAVVKDCNDPQWKQCSIKYILYLHTQNNLPNYLTNCYHPNYQLCYQCDHEWSTLKIGTIYCICKFSIAFYESDVLLKVKKFSDNLSLSKLSATVC